MLQAIAKALVGGGAEGIANTISKTVDQFIETPDEKRDFEKFRLQIQADVNQAEAGHRTLFVAGWRPWIGWVGGMGLALYFIPQYVAGAAIWCMACWQVLQTTAITADNVTSVLPPYPVTADGLLELVIGMLGLGTLRTLEKAAGKAK